MKNHSKINTTHERLRTPRPTRHDEDKFGDMVTVLPSGCWRYGASLAEYGYFNRTNARSIAAHRYTYTMLVGPIPDGFHVHHTCLNPGCVNPKHLEALSPSDHAARHAQIRRECA